MAVLAGQSNILDHTEISQKLLVDFLDFCGFENNVLKTVGWILP